MTSLDFSYCFISSHAGSKNTVSSDYCFNSFKDDLIIKQTKNLGNLIFMFYLKLCSLVAILFPSE